MEYGKMLKMMKIKRLINDYGEVILIYLAFLFWVMGDLFSTYLGFQVGLTERNPFLQGFNIIIIGVIKLIVFAIVLYACKMIKEGVCYQKTRYILYVYYIIFGLFLTIMNLKEVIKCMN